MKLGIFMLIFGLILAGAGIAVWMYANVDEAYMYGSRFSLDQLQVADAGGIGCAVFGGGLAVGGIVRMIMKK